MLQPTRKRKAAPASLAAPLLLLFPLLQAVNAIETPNRVIVPSLTQELKQQLQKRDVSILLVLPGPVSLQNISVEFDELSLPRPIEYLHSFDDFTSHWHKAARREHSRGLRGLRSWRQLLQHAAGLTLPGDPLLSEMPPPTPKQLPPTAQQQQQQQRPKVALLMLASNGIVHSSQASLATAVARRLRNTLVVTFTHSTHKDKPETLVTFNGDGQPVAAAVQESTVFRDAFTNIYASKAWGNEGGGSGLGSTLEYTANVRKLLLDVLTRYKIKSMLDSSCGSMHWMPLVLQEYEKQQQDFKFMGTDVVCFLIEGHKRNFSSHTNWDFKCVDYSAQPLPTGYELVWSRDSLQHVPMHGAWQFLNNVKASGAKYLLVGSYITDKRPNTDIVGGEYYPIDLLEPPFNVSKPLEVIDEHTEDGKHLLLFEVAKMTWSDPLPGLLRRRLR